MRAGAEGVAGRAAAEEVAAARGGRAPAADGRGRSAAGAACGPMTRGMAAAHACRPRVRRGHHRDGRICARLPQRRRPRVGVPPGLHGGVPPRLGGAPGGGAGRAAPAGGHGGCQLGAGSAFSCIRHRVGQR